MSRECIFEQILEDYIEIRSVFDYHRTLNNYCKFSEFRDRYRVLEEQLIKFAPEAYYNYKLVHNRLFENLVQKSGVLIDAPI